MANRAKKRFVAKCARFWILKIISGVNHLSIFQALDRLEGDLLVRSMPLYDSIKSNWKAQDAFL